MKPTARPQHFQKSQQSPPACSFDAADGASGDANNGIVAALAAVQAADT